MKLSDWQTEDKLPEFDGIYHILNGSSFGWSYFENGKWTLPDFRLKFGKLTNDIKSRCHYRRVIYNNFGPYKWRGVLEE